MCAGTRDDGTVIGPNDPDRSGLTYVAAAARLRPGAWLERRDINGTFVEEPGFVEAIMSGMA